MMRLGFVLLSNLSMAGASLRSYSLLRGTMMSWQPISWSFSTTKVPKNPAPPVTRTRWRGQNVPGDLGMGLQARGERLGVMFAKGFFFAGHFEVGVHHQADEFLKF